MATWYPKNPCSNGCLVERPNFFMNIMIWNRPVETTLKNKNDWLSGARMYQAFKGPLNSSIFSCRKLLTVHERVQTSLSHFAFQSSFPKKNLRCLRKVRLGRNRNYKGGPKNQLQVCTSNVIR